jgi:hypothetical protein
MIALEIELGTSGFVARISEHRPQRKQNSFIHIFLQYSLDRSRRIFRNIEMCIIFHSGKDVLQLNNFIQINSLYSVM